jgi:hypothetical protein
VLTAQPALGDQRDRRPAALAAGLLGALERELQERLGRGRLARWSASCRNALAAGGWRRPARQTSAVGQVSSSGPTGRKVIAGPGSAAIERGSTATPRPLETSARTAPISVQMKALRGSSPNLAIAFSRRRRSAEFSR